MLEILGCESSSMRHVLTSDSKACTITSSLYRRSSCWTAGLSNILSLSTATTALERGEQVHPRTPHRCTAGMAHPAVSAAAEGDVSSMPQSAPPGRARHRPAAAPLLARLYVVGHNTGQLGQQRYLRAIIDEQLPDRPSIADVLGLKEANDPGEVRAETVGR